MSEQKLDIVDRAEKVIKGLKTDKEGNIGLNTNQLRKVLSAVVSVKNKVELELLRNNNKKGVISPDLALEIKFLKTNILYQIGRDESKEGYFKDFVDKSNIVLAIEFIANDYMKFQAFCKYMEALVAFHKYYSAIKK